MNLYILVGMHELLAIKYWWINDYPVTWDLHLVLFICQYEMVDGKTYVIKFEEHAWYETDNSYVWNAWTLSLLT